MASSSVESSPLRNEDDERGSSFEHYKVQVWLGHQQPTVTTTSSATATEPEEPEGRSAWTVREWKRKRDDRDCDKDRDRHNREAAADYRHRTRRSPLRENTTMNNSPAAAKESDADRPKRPKRTGGAKPQSQQEEQQQQRGGGGGGGPLQRISQRSSPRKNANANAPPSSYSQQLVGGGDGGELAAGAVADVGGYSRALQLEHDYTILPPRRGMKSNSSTQSRSSSPVKTIFDLGMGGIPITYSEANSKQKPPDEVHRLYTKVLDAADGIGLLPASLKDSIETYCKEFATRTPRDEYFQRPSSDPPRQPTLEELHTWEAAKRIRENATRCSEDGDSEAGWGEMVYSQILDVALRYSPQKQSVGWKNITTARIEPKSLNPRHINGKPFGSKMVDYAMLLLPDPKTHHAILQVLCDLPEEDQNINQTNFAPLKYRPITVNFEVKLPGEGQNDAKVQLAEWASAQLQKLNALSGGSLAPIGIPLVSVAGHNWRLYITYFQTDESWRAVAQPVWGGEQFGDSLSTFGIYKVIAGLRVLAEWSDGEYRAWLEREVLGFPEWQTV